MSPGKLFWGERYQLVSAAFVRELTEGEAARLQSLEARLIEFERTQADDFDRSYPETRAGLLDAKLDQLERFVQELRKHGK